MGNRGKLEEIMEKTREIMETWERNLVDKEKFSMIYLSWIFMAIFMGKWWDHADPVHYVQSRPPRDIY